jgi:hypothetical protein
MRRGFLLCFGVAVIKVKGFNHRGHEGTRRNAYVACDEQDLGP